MATKKKDEKLGLLVNKAVGRYSPNSQTGKAVQDLLDYIDFNYKKVR
jgi:hypothetical protein